MKNYVTDGTVPASAVFSDGQAVYTPGVGEYRNGAAAVYHFDGQGNTRGITDTTQVTTDSATYDAFGGLVQRAGSRPLPFGFMGEAGYQTDDESGLMLLGNRYYDSIPKLFGMPIKKIYFRFNQDELVQTE